ncbi:DUF4123 domain-containing protein [Tateyamaria armeniaca]|uniref:DUF4123 domain-containing protein n=1 Tax=Tateyamaria armeniaca TaxID=2518930 RepID=A0ABW8USL8_9RHOB
MTPTGTFGVIDLASAVPLRSKVVRLEPPMACSLLDASTYLDVVPVGPWLIDLDKCSELRRIWVKQVRNVEWGYTIRTSLNIADLRRHLRKFAMADVEGQPKPVLFRYFDARIIRAFLLEVFTPEERQSFLAPMHSLEVRGPDGNGTLVFEPDASDQARLLYAK